MIRWIALSMITFVVFVITLFVHFSINVMQKPSIKKFTGVLCYVLFFLCCVFAVIYGIVVYKNTGIIL